MALELVMATGPFNESNMKEYDDQKKQQYNCHHEQMRTRSGLVGGVQPGLRWIADTKGGRRTSYQSGELYGAEVYG